MLLTIPSGSPQRLQSTGRPLLLRSAWAAKLAAMRRPLLVSALAVFIAAAAPSPVPKRLQAPFASLRPAAELRLGKTADWVLATDDAVWVGSTGPFAVHRIDPTANREVASVQLPGEPCAGLAAGFGSLWVPLCGKSNALARVDLKTNRLAAVLPVGPAAAEGGIAAGGDSVWMVTDAKGSLARIDPETGRVRQTIALPAGSYNPLYSDGVVWVTGHDAGVVTAVEASTGKVLAAVPVGEGPRFLTAGAGSIWVLLQGTGEVVRIDARTRKAVARIAAGLVGHGGDISFGARRVWPTLSGAPLTEIDARSGRIRRQWVGPGGDSLAWAFDAIWLTDYKAGTVARYPAATLGLR
jgi:virginiamycin B lyase